MSIFILAVFAVLFGIWAWSIYVNKRRQIVAISVVMFVLLPFMAWELASIEKRYLESTSKRVVGLLVELYDCCPNDFAEQLDALDSDLAADVKVLHAQSRSIRRMRSVLDGMVE